MKNIYKIVNDINDLVYVGQTKHSLNERLQMHLRDSRKKRCENRSLYKAFNSIGFEHFSIILLEICEDAIANEREIYWIDSFNSYLNGYNDTYGGEGKHQINYQEVVNLYNEHKNITKISQIINRSIAEISHILRINNIQVLVSGEVVKGMMGKKVNQYTLDGVFVASYDTVREAERQTGFLNAHISEVCLGKRKTAYGFKWSFA